jgi:hypothetical protein
MINLQERPSEFSYGFGVTREGLALLNSVGLSPTAREPRIEAIDNNTTEGRKPQDILTDKRNSFTNPGISISFDERGIRDTEIMADHMPLLDVERQHLERFEAQGGKRIDTELGKTSARTIDVLEVVADRFDRRSLGRALSQAVLVDRLKRRLESGNYIFMGIAEKPVGEFFLLQVERLGDSHLLPDKGRLTGEMQVDIGRAAVRAEQ